MIAFLQPPLVLFPRDLFVSREFRSGLGRLVVWTDKASWTWNCLPTGTKFQTTMSQKNLFVPFSHQTICPCDDLCVFWCENGKHGLKQIKSRRSILRTQHKIRTWPKPMPLLSWWCSVRILVHLFALIAGTRTWSERFLVLLRVYRHYCCCYCRNWLKSANADNN